MEGRRGSPISAFAEGGVRMKHFVLGVAQAELAAGTPKMRIDAGQCADGGSAERDKTDENKLRIPCNSIKR